MSFSLNFLLTLFFLDSFLMSFLSLEGELCVLDFGMMSEMPKDALLAVIQHIVHVTNRPSAFKDMLLKGMENHGKQWKRGGFQLFLAV